MKNGAIYPTWHDKPLRLTVDEMSNPMKVLEDFCWEYPLPEVRPLLWEWLSAALNNSEANAGSILNLFESLIKLIEAAHVINSDRNNQEL